MAKIESLNILLTTTGRDYLAELSGVVIENIQKEALSSRLKNTDLSGDPVSGTVEVRRFANAASKAYGTARTAGAGDAVKASPVTVAIDQDKEIVEELEAKDVRLYSVDNVLQRRASNHVLSVAVALDKAFFSAAATAATSVNISTALAVEDALEKIIQELETVQNEFVEGVPRDMMALTLSPEWYGKIRNALDKKTRVNVDTTAEEFYVWHGVEVNSSVRLPSGCDILLMIKGAVAQPVMMDQYTAEKVPLSNAYGVELFYHYGTKAVTPDLILKANLVDPT